MGMICTGIYILSRSSAGRIGHRKLQTNRADNHLKTNKSFFSNIDTDFLTILAVYLIPILRYNF